MPPELAEQLALKLDTPHPFRIGRHLDRRNNPIQIDFEIAAGRIEMNLLRLADEIAR